MAVTTEQMTREVALTLLGLDQNAKHDDTAITQAFKAKALTAHPDKGGTAEKYKQITAAKDFLLKKETSALSLDETSTSIDVFKLIANCVNGAFAKPATEKSLKLLLELKYIVGLINENPVSFAVPAVIARCSDYLQKAESQEKYILNNGFTLNGNNYTVYELAWLLSRVAAGKIQLQRDLKFKTKSTKLKKLLAKLINRIAKAEKLHAAIKTFHPDQMDKELVGCKLYSLNFITIVGLILQLCWLIAFAVLTIKFFLLFQLGTSLLISLFTSSTILLATSYLAPIIIIVLIIVSIRHLFFVKLCELYQKSQASETAALTDYLKKNFLLLASALLILILLLLPVIITIAIALIVLFLPDIKYYLSCFIGYLSILIDINFNKKELVEQFTAELYKRTEIDDVARIPVQEHSRVEDLTEIKPSLVCRVWDKIFSKKSKDESGEILDEMPGVRLVL